MSSSNNKKLAFQINYLNHRSVPLLLTSIIVSRFYTSEHFHNACSTTWWPTHPVWINNWLYSNLQTNDISNSNKQERKQSWILSCSVPKNSQMTETVICRSCASIQLHELRTSFIFQNRTTKLCHRWVKDTLRQKHALVLCTAKIIFLYLCTTTKSKDDTCSFLFEITK